MAKDFASEVDSALPSQHVVGNVLQQRRCRIEGAIVPATIALRRFAGMNLARLDDHQSAGFRHTFVSGDSMPLRAASKSGDHELFVEMSRITVVETRGAQELEPARYASVSPQPDL